MQINQQLVRFNQQENLKRLLVYINCSLVNANRSLVNINQVLSK